MSPLIEYIKRKIEKSNKGIVFFEKNEIKALLFIIDILKEENEYKSNYIKELEAQHIRDSINNFERKNI